MQVVCMYAHASYMHTSIHPYMRYLQRGRLCWLRFRLIQDAFVNPRRDIFSYSRVTVVQLHSVGRQSEFYGYGSSKIGA